MPLTAVAGQATCGSAPSTGIIAGAAGGLDPRHLAGARNCPEALPERLVRAALATTLTLVAIKLVSTFNEY